MVSATVVPVDERAVPAPTWASEREALHARLAALEARVAKSGTEARQGETEEAVDEEDVVVRKSNIYSYAMEAILTDRLGGGWHRLSALLWVVVLVILQFLFAYCIFDFGLADKIAGDLPKYRAQMDPAVWYVHALVNDRVPLQHVLLSFAALMLHCEVMHADSQETLVSTHPLEPLCEHLLRILIGAPTRTAAVAAPRPQGRRGLGVLAQQCGAAAARALLMMVWCLRSTLVPGLAVFGLATLFANEGAADIIKDSLAVAFIFELDNALYPRLIRRSARARYERLITTPDRLWSGGAAGGARALDVCGGLLFVLDAAMAVLFYLGVSGVAPALLGEPHPLLATHDEFRFATAAQRYLVTHALLRGATLAAGHVWITYLRLATAHGAKHAGEQAPLAPPHKRGSHAVRIGMWACTYWACVVASTVVTFVVVKVVICDHALGLATRGLYVGNHPFVLSCVRGRDSNGVTYDEAACHSVPDGMPGSLDALRCFLSRTYDFSLAAVLESTWGGDGYPLLAPLLEGRADASGCPSLPLPAATG